MINDVARFIDYTVGLVVMTVIVLTNEHSLSPFFPLFSEKIVHRKNVKEALFSPHGKGPVYCLLHPTCCPTYCTYSSPT